MRSKSNLLIAVHEGKYYKRSDGLAVGPGCFTKGLEYATGRKAIVIGKPNRYFFECVMPENVAPAECCMIGDVSRMSLRLPGFTILYNAFPMTGFEWRCLRRNECRNERDPGEDWQIYWEYRVDCSAATHQSDRFVCRCCWLVASGEIHHLIMQQNEPFMCFLIYFRHDFHEINTTSLPSRVLISNNMEKVINQYCSTI